MTHPDARFFEYACKQALTLDLDHGLTGVEA